MPPSAWIKWQVQRGDGSAFSLSYSRRAFWFAALMEWAEDLPGAKARIVRKRSLKLSTTVEMYDFAS